MKEELISLSTAKLAKEKGFRDLPCIKCKNFGLTNLKSYNENGELSYRKFYCADNPFSLAPTQSSLQKWLREEHGIHIQIDHWEIQRWYFSIFYRIDQSQPVKRVTYNLKPYQFDTYEQALEVGLQEALKLIELP